MSVAHPARFVTPFGSTRAMSARASAGVAGSAVGAGALVVSGPLAQPAIASANEAASARRRAADDGVTIEQRKKTGRMYEASAHYRRIEPRAHVLRRCLCAGEM